MMGTKNHRSSILIIYTGGTIGMATRPKTGILSPLRFDQILEEVPELNKFNYDFKTITFENPIDSSNVNIEIWVKIAKTIEENYQEFDGFVILHGTDTMSYTASALSYMFENLDKPIILTGSQLPIGTLRTDGKENLITAIEIAADKKDGKAVVPEVCIYFNSKLFRGNRTVKLNSEDFSAFNSENYPPLAIAGVDIIYYPEYIYYPVNKGILKVNTSFDNNVAILKMFPGINENVFKSVLNIKGLKGIVLESFGSGNVPTTLWLVKCIKKAIENEIIILNVTQCLGGKVNMRQYEPSFELLKAGVLSGKDMTTEAAITKLMFLLGQQLSLEEIKMYLIKSLSGEISV